ncbi:flagellar hook-length control protein FliK|uniref:flagellar hook-length control protein FliK n=1 Tax=Noviherbaspirillum sp. L7-7A TaxID=2850560 RepID=UPI001C2C6C74|nr:flagellar hook-length control protein FliK [Noviherbaspirillum sp. L7-7A]MBV0879238.1 flagellar hook-length control protein FliK [Noviherbaspirillum sp. L7-7A]
MNLPSIVNTLAGLGAGNAAAAKAGAQQPSTPFNQLLSREVAQRPPSQANAAPQQQARAPEAARPQAHKAESGQQTGRTEAAEQPPAQPGAAGPAAAPTTEAAQSEQPAAEDSAASLADIPGAPQAALMMQLMASATAAATTTPAQETGTAADAPPAVAIGKGGKDAETQGPPDLRAPAATMQEGDTALAGKGEGQPAPDLQAAFGKAVAEAASQRPVAVQAATQADAAPATVLATLQAATQAVHTPTAHVDRLTPAVGTPAWDQALGQKIVWMAQGGEQSASLTMNPPELGPMQVVLSVSNNQATVDFMAAQPEVRQALEAALPRLREMMGESGIQLGQANVSAGGQQQFAGFDGGSKSGGRGNADHGGAEAPQLRQGVVRIARDGAVDTFA